MDETEHQRIQCPACGWTGWPKLARKAVPDGFHVGAYCRQCGSWIKWLTQDLGVLAELRKQEEKERHGIERMGQEGA